MEIQLVKMCKPNQLPGMPSTADVHPDEVENMQATGWQVSEDTPSEGGDSFLDELMELSVKQLRSLSADCNVTLTREDNRKDEIAQRIIEQLGNAESAASA